MYLSSATSVHLVAAGFGQRLERLGLKHNNRAVFEAHPAARRPHAQLLVDALAGHADHFADFLLGDCDRPALRRELVLFGQTNKRTREPSRQVLENDLLDLIASPANSGAEQLDEF